MLLLAVFLFKLELIIVRLLSIKQKVKQLKLNKFYLNQKKLLLLLILYPNHMKYIDN